MLWHLSGEDLTLRFDFLSEGALVVPDADSISLTLRDHQGALIAPYNPELHPSAGTSLEVVISGASNTLALADTVESRFVTLTYRVNGVPRTIRNNYKISEFLPISATPVDVRNLLGLIEDELPDDEVDLYQAYYQLLMDNAGLSAALGATTVANLLANRAIALQAALLLAPGLPARFGQRSTSADQEFTRFANLKVDELVEKLEAELETTLAEMAAPGEVEVVSPTRFLIAPRTDPITGA